MTVLYCFRIILCFWRKAKGICVTVCAHIYMLCSSGISTLLLWGKVLTNLVSGPQHVVGYSLFTLVLGSWFGLPYFHSKSTYLFTHWANSAVPQALEAEKCLPWWWLMPVAQVLWSLRQVDCRIFLGQQEVQDETMSQKSKTKSYNMK